MLHARVKFEYGFYIFWRTAAGRLRCVPVSHFSPRDAQLTLKGPRDMWSIYLTLIHVRDEFQASSTAMQGLFT